jgi:hypothetical protein
MDGFAQCRRASLMRQSVMTSHAASRNTSSASPTLPRLANQSWVSRRCNCRSVRSRT